MDSSRPRTGADAELPALSIIMPVFNERATLESAISQVLEVELPLEALEVIVVDDGSTDGSAELLRERRWPDTVRVHFHERNCGKGAAIQTGLGVARGTYVTIMDADLEYSAVDLPALLEHLLAGEADVVYGVRGFQAHSAYNFWYVVGNKLMTLAANVLYNSWLSDIMTCHKVMATELFRSLPLREQGFAIEPEITARLLRAGVRIFEVPIVYRARSREEGKKLTQLDGPRILATLVRCRLDRAGGRLAVSGGRSAGRDARVPLVPRA